MSILAVCVIYGGILSVSRMRAAFHLSFELITQSSCRSEYHNVYIAVCQVHPMYAFVYLIFVYF